jgi:hypothetical protein
MAILLRDRNNAKETELDRGVTLHSDVLHQL